MSGFFPDLEGTVYALALLGAFCLGVSKTGFPGLALVNVLIMAELFGAKPSVGIVLPLLVFADLSVYHLFRKYSSWRAVWSLVPPAVLGVIAGYFLLGAITNQTSRRLIGGITLIMVVLQVLRAYRSSFLAGLPDSKGFLWGTGLVMGVSTTLANAAGGPFSVYALVHRMAKEDFLGIGARFFLFMNLFKLPFLGQLDLINPNSLKIDLMLLPGVVVGILSGRRLIALVPQRVFEVLLYLFAGVAGLRLLFF